MTHQGGRRCRNRAHARSCAHEPVASPRRADRRPRRGREGRRAAGRGARRRAAARARACARSTSPARRSSPATRSAGSSRVARERSAAPRRPACRPSCASRSSSRSSPRPSSRGRTRTPQLPDDSVCARRRDQPDRHPDAAQRRAAVRAVRARARCSAAAPDERARRTASSPRSTGRSPRRLFSTMLGQLSLIWNDVAERRARARRPRGTTENAADRRRSASRRSSLTVEARIARTSSTLSLLVPFCAIAPVAGRVLAARRRRPADDDGATGEARRRRARAASRSRCAPRSSDSAHDRRGASLALKPGDVLRLDGQARHGVTLFAGQVPVHRARPGRSGRKRAVQILGPVEDAR